MNYFSSVSLLVPVLILLCFSSLKINAKLKKEALDIFKPYEPSDPENEVKEGVLKSCTCGIFLASQVTKKGGPPTGNPVLQHTYDNPVLPEGNLGVKLCTNKCIELVTKHLPNSQEILCAVLDRDIEGEKAHLFVKNCEDKWVNTNLSSAQSYCCKDGSPYTRPLLPTSILIKKLPH